MMISPRCFSGQRAFSMRPIVTALCLMTLVQQLTASQNPFKKLVGGDRDVKYKTYKDPAGKFSFDYPEKDWRLYVSGGATLTVARNDGPAFFVDHLVLRGTLAPEEIEAFSENEVDRLKKQEPTGKDFTFNMLGASSGRGVLIKYSRVASVPESVVQYSVPVGLDLYRLRGVLPEKLASKYEPIIMHMVQSFKAAAEPAGSKD